MPPIRCQTRPAARRLICAGLALIGVMQMGWATADSALPEGFAYLREVDPTIAQDIRYAGSHNFVGRPVKGYLAAECILSEGAARALAVVQKKLAEQKFSLIVWDCYRPKRAVEDFLQWSRDPSHSEMKAEFYPHTDKDKMFVLGYLATRSAHSRGSTVDLGIVPAPFSAPPFDPAQPLKACTLPKGERFEDGAIAEAGEAALRNRQMLKSLMQGAGFRPYSKEWWHFELVDEPFRQDGFDFEVTASPRAGQR
jgi:zinc D-Ala-D-Ala dipeptidase